MITKTNFQMLKELLNDFKPKDKGVLSKEEAAQIKEVLCISERDVLSLRNLRDFTVLYLSKKQDSEQRDNINMINMIETSDITSAITHIIDLEIFNKGGEV